MFRISLYFKEYKNAYGNSAGVMALGNREKIRSNFFFFFIVVVCGGDDEYDMSDVPCNFNRKQ